MLRNYTTNKKKTMKDFKDLQRLVDLIIENRLSKTQTLFMGADEYSETMDLFKNLGSSGVLSASHPDYADLKCVTINYNGIRFYIVNY